MLFQPSISFDCGNSAQPLFDGTRIDAAKRLLIDTTLRVIDICYEVGYNSLGTFSSRFTELVGISPQGFRELADQDNWRLFQAFLQAQNEHYQAYFIHTNKSLWVRFMPLKQPKHPLRLKPSGQQHPP